MRKRTHENDDARYLSIEQLATRLNVGTTTARKIAVKAGGLRKILGTTRADIYVIDEYIAQDCAVSEM